MNARYEDVLRFDSVVVAESLPANHQKTGDWLVKNVLRPIEQQDDRLQVMYNHVSTAREFFALMDVAEQQLFRRGHAPILHLEMHGTKEGLVLANGEIIDWEALRERLTRMNEACGLNLLLMMAMCYGYYLGRLLMPTMKAPVWGLVGPSDKVWDTDLRNATQAFYTELFASLQGDSAVRAMNQYKPIGQSEYQFLSAELMYCKAFGRYVHQYCTPELLKDRENEIVAEIVRRRGGDLLVAFDARYRAKDMLRRHEEYFEFLKETYFMFDVLPEGRTRFQLRFTDCVELTRPETTG